MRVLRWMIDRLEGRAPGVEHALGISPTYDEMHWDGLAFGRDRFDAVTRIERDHWVREFDMHQALFDQLADHLPAALADTKAQLAQRLLG